MGNLTKRDKQSRTERREEKLGKTCGLLTVVSLLPFIVFDEKTAVFFSFILTSLAIATLHEVGYNRRPGSNFWSSIQTSFSPSPKAERLAFKNAVFNVINGGGAVVDELKHEVDKYLNRR